MGSLNSIELSSLLCTLSLHLRSSSTGEKRELNLKLSEKELQVTVITCSFLVNVPILGPSLESTRSSEQSTALER